MNGRLYDPLLGRFLSPDPIVANPAHGQQWNLYSYAVNSPLSYIDPSGLSQCNPAQQSWCGGYGLPRSGWLGGGGYGTRTVTGTSVHVTFGIYHQIVRIWRSSSSFGSWGAGDYDGGWSDDIFWEDVQRTAIYPIVHIFRWAFQVVEQSVAAEPASSAELGFFRSIFEVDRNGGIVSKSRNRPVRRTTNVPEPFRIEDDYWWVEDVLLKGKNGEWYIAEKWLCGNPGGQSNCHGVSTAGGQYWINGPEMERILEDFFTPVGELEKANLVVWYKEGQVTHSAITSSVGGSLDTSLAEGWPGKRRQ